MNYIINMATTKKPTINTTTGGNVVGTIQPTHEGATSVNYSQLSTPPTPTPTQKQPITQTPVVKQTPAVTQTPSSTVKPTTITTSANNVNTKTPTETLSTFDLQNAQNAAQNLNKWTNQILGQNTTTAPKTDAQLNAENPAYWPNGLGVVNAETGKVEMPSSTNVNIPKSELTPSQKTLQDMTATQQEATEKSITEQKAVQQQAQGEIATTGAQISANLINYQQEYKNQKILEDTQLLSDNNAQIQSLKDSMMAKLSAAGVAEWDTASMNAGLRQEYNAYVAQISVLESVNAAIRGNLTTAANVVDNYYKTNVQFLQDKANNYNLLLSSAGTELNRLTEVQKQDIQTQIDLLNSQISDEKAKQATYNTILASPSYQKAVTQYQLSPSDDIYTQASKIQQAEAEDKILTDLMTTYFDAGITLKDSLISAKEKLLLSPTYQQKVNKSTGTISTTDVLNLATSLYNSDPYTYGSVANAIPAAMQYANLVEGGANPDVSLLYVNNNNTADRSTVDKQIQDVATFVFGNSDIGSVSVRQEKVRAIKQYATAGDYDTLEQYLYTTATQGLSADEQKTFNSNIMVTAAFEAIQPELQKLYNEYGFNGKLGLKYVNGALQFFGETPVDANQQAILAKVNTMIQSSFVKYRQSLTGAQFSNAESEAYQKLWLDIKNSQALNDAIFSGQYTTAKSSTNAYLSKVIGENGIALLENLRGANNIFKTYKNNTVMGDIAASYATDVAGFNAAYIGRYGNYECGQYVNQYIQEQTGKYGIFGDSIDSKIEAIKKYGGLTDTSNYQFEVGDIIVQKFNKQQDPKQYGHVAIVRKVYPNGTLDLAEANYNGDKKITYGRVINSNSSTIAGVLPRKILTK